MSMFLSIALVTATVSTARDYSVRNRFGIGSIDPILADTPTLSIP
jgi:hypothetical protein